MDGGRGNQPRYTRTLLCPRSGGDVQVGDRRWYRMEGRWTGCMGQSAKVYKNLTLSTIKAVILTVQVGILSAGRGRRGTGWREDGRWQGQSATVYENLILCTSQTVTVQLVEEVGTGGREGDRGVWSNQPRYTRTLFCPRPRR